MQAFYQSHNQLFHCFYFNMESFPAHLHKEIEIAYVEAGRMQVQADGLEFELMDGDAMVLLPNVIHSYQMERGSRILMTVFDRSITARPFGNLMACSSTAPYVRSDRVHPDIPQCMKKLLYLDRDQEKAPISSVIGYHILILGHILNAIPMAYEEKIPADNHIQRILTFAAQHFLEPLTIEDIASEAGLSKYYVSKIFNGKIHCSFPDYLNALRLNHAAGRLLSTSDTVENIALSSGFESERSFYRNFRKLYHTTPREYRKSYGKIR